MDLEGWGLWPDQPAQGAPQEVNVELNNPILPQPGEAFLELNDLVQVPVNDIDLNAPLEDDLGGIDQLLEIAENLDNPPFGPHLEDVIVEDVLSEDESDDEHLQANNLGLN
jgi:hypothetical protein